MGTLGEMINGGSEEPAEGSWSDLVKDPIARSALLGFGIQMMTGGWGNGTQQLAAGIGAGATSAAATSEAMQKQMEADDKAAGQEANQAANRANAIKVAQIGADSRAEVANLRGEFSLERARLGLQSKASPNDIIKYRTEARKTVEGNLQNMSLPQAQREAMIEDLAGRMYDADAARGLVGRGASGATSPNVPGAPGAPVSGQSPAPKAGAKPAAQNPATPQADDGTAAALANPKMRELLSTPEGQAQLRKMDPGKAETLIRKWNEQQTLSGHTFPGWGQK